MHSSALIFTPRLELVPVSIEMARAQLDDCSELGRLLGTRIPESWPPSLVDSEVIKWVIKKLEKDADHLVWGSRYFVLREPRLLIGLGGFKGSPTKEGIVEVGYSIVEDEQRKGYATEAVTGLCQRAFSDPRVRRVMAETYPDLIESVCVLEKSGFAYAGNGSEFGMVRYELLRKKASGAKF
ncbi:MAG: acetyltransferase, ribosomal protein N-acetylase [Pedosphaera sp.]|nr:acetyltransferase, ribosomal protein N-acetylase [Pedosphaera sp.]